MRNSKVVDIIRELKSYGVEVFVTDPMADGDEAHHEYGVDLTPFNELPKADALVVAVAHQEYKILTIEVLGKKLIPYGAFIDVKSLFDPQPLRDVGYRVWRL